METKKLKKIYFSPIGYINKEEGSGTTDTRALLSYALEHADFIRWQIEVFMLVRLMAKPSVQDSSVHQWASS